MLNPEENRIHFSWQRLNYAAELTHQNMHNAGLKAGYAEALLTGLWLSMDILPATEKGRNGELLEIDDLVY